MEGNPRFDKAMAAAVAVLTSWHDFWHGLGTTEVESPLVSGVIWKTMVDKLGRQFCDSPIERQFWEHAEDRIRGLTPQYRISEMHVDFAVPAARVAIECDGHEHHSKPDDIERDKRRDSVLDSLGWRVVRLTGTQINRDVGRCVLDVQRAIRESEATA